MTDSDKHFTVRVAGERMVASLTRTTVDAAISEALRLAEHGPVQIEDPNGGVYSPDAFDRLRARWTKLRLVD